MSNPRFTPGILASLFSLCLGVSIQAQPGETKAGTATVSGLVTLKGEPARGVTVLLQAQRSNPASSPRAKTDENGRFRFTGVAAGRYSIFALAPGYISPGDEAMVRRGQTLNVAEGERVENIDLEIKRGGVIAGRITDSRGSPVIEETVKLTRPDKDGRSLNDSFYGANYDMYLTDDRGSYRIYGLPEGRYLVSVGYEQKPGSVSVTSRRVFYPRTFYPGATIESKAKVIEVTEGAEATDVDITVADAKRTCEISGRVVDADTGQPVAGVEIVVGSLSPEGKPTGGWSGSGELSAANGEFRLIGVLSGRYSLLVRPDVSHASPGFPGRPGGSSDSGLIGEPVMLNIEDDVAGVEVKVRQGASISGVAVIEGTNDPKILSKLSQARIYASVRSGSPNQQALLGISDGKVNPDGSFRIRGLQAGRVVFSLSGLPNTKGLVLARIEYNGAAAREGIDVEAGQQMTGVRVVLVHSALTLRGELKVVGGELPRGLRFVVTASSVDQPTQGLPGAEVDARGQFLFESAPPGEYEIRVFPIYNPNGRRLDSRTAQVISLVKERVVVAGDNQQPVVLVIDLSRKEGNQ